jgi:hypothetical protein
MREVPNTYYENSDVVTEWLGTFCGACDEMIAD